MGIQNPKKLSPGKKALHTAKWARTMTKWWVTFSRRSGASWKLVEFGGKTGAESRGIVDLIAIRKNHRDDVAGLERGDLFEMVFIQTKGGSAQRPTKQDITRLIRAATYHRAKAIVLVEWNKGETIEISRLNKRKWERVRPEDVFG